MIAYQPLVGKWHTPLGHPVEFAYRDATSDWNTISATLTHDEYGIPSGMSGHAVDVGGYVGSVGIGLAVDNPALRVTIIEPVPANAALIRENIARNDVSDRVTLIEGAASGDREPVTVWYGYRGNEAAEHHAFVGNSTLAYSDGWALEHDEVTYTPVTLRDLAPIDYLKIDCEGGEWSILRDIPRIPTIVGESHAVSGRRGGDIVALLPDYDVTLSGDASGTCGFRAVLR